MDLGCATSQQRGGQERPGQLSFLFPAPQYLCLPGGGIEGPTRHWPLSYTCSVVSMHPPGCPPLQPGPDTPTAQGIAAHLPLLPTPLLPPPPPQPLAQGGSSPGARELWVSLRPHPHLSGTLSPYSAGTSDRDPESMGPGAHCAPPPGGTPGFPRPSLSLDTLSVRRAAGLPLVTPTPPLTPLPGPRPSPASILLHGLCRPCTALCSPTPWSPHQPCSHPQALQILSPTPQETGSWSRVQETHEPPGPDWPLPCLGFPPGGTWLGPCSPRAVGPSAPRARLPSPVHVQHHVHRGLGSGVGRVQGGQGLGAPGGEPAAGDVAPAGPGKRSADSGSVPGSALVFLPLPALGGCVCSRLLTEGSLPSWLPAPRVVTPAPPWSGSPSPAPSSRDLIPSLRPLLRPGPAGEVTGQGVATWSPLGRGGGRRGWGPGDPPRGAVSPPRSVASPVASRLHPAGGATTGPSFSAPVRPQPLRERPGWLVFQVGKLRLREAEPGPEAAGRVYTPERRVWDPGLRRAGRSGARSTLCSQENQGQKGHFFQAALQDPDGLRRPRPSVGTGLPHPARTGARTDGVESDPHLYD